jgi:deazaflavin-dependent oxidoreductase (nitroreductase family)
MTASRHRPLGRRVQAQVFRTVNVPMRGVLGLPFPTPLGRRLMLLFLTGRKTGKKYRQPVSYVRDGDTLLTPGGGNWKLNLVAGQPVRVRIGGKDRLATPEIIREPDDVEPLLEKMAKANPMTERFVRIPRDAQGRFDRAGLETAVRYGFAIVRWRLDDTR